MTDLDLEPNIPTVLTNFQVVVAITTIIMGAFQMPQHSRIGAGYGE